MTDNPDHMSTAAKDLAPFFEPRSVAVIGASDSPTKISYCCVESLVEGGFGGRIYPVNPRTSEILGLQVYRSVVDIPDEVDLAVIVVAADTVPSVLDKCARKAIRAAVIITAGFRELGTEWGARLQDEITAISNQAGINIIGPNTIGTVNPQANLNATFLPSFKDLRPGSVAIIAQSGGVCSFLLHSAINEHLGISLATSLGNRANVDFADVIEYLGDHQQTRAIALHIEGVDDPHRLMETARRVGCQKPIIACKPGGPILDKAAYSHTGSLAGKNETYDAAFSQAGVVSVEDTTELMDVAKALAFQPAPRGNRVAVLSLQAGPGMIAASACLECGLTLADLSPRAKMRLQELAITPSFSDNPIDMAGAFTQSGSNHQKWQEIVELALGDEGVDAVVLSAVYHRLDIPFIERVARLAQVEGLTKPLVVCRDSPLAIARPGISRLEENSIPVYPSPVRAVKALAGMVRYGQLTAVNR